MHAAPRLPPALQGTGGEIMAVLASPRAFDAISVHYDVFGVVFRRLPPLGEVVERDAHGSFRFPQVSCRSDTNMSAIKNGWETL